MYKKKLIATLVILSCISLMLIVTPQAKATQFIVASWSYPDEYGQGLDSWYADSNRTGSWVSFAWGFSDDDGDSPSSGPISWNVSQVIRIVVWTTLNNTFLGLDSLEEGKNYVKHNITVTNQWDVEVFSQQNFTCTYNESYEGLYYYRHSVILNFLPLEGEFYTVIILCEIYW